MSKNEKPQSSGDKLLTPQVIEDLVRIVKEQRDGEDSEYPCTVARVIALSGVPGLSASMLARKGSLRTRLAIGCNSKARGDVASQALVTTLEDFERLVQSGELLRQLIARKRTPKNQAASIAELTGLLHSRQHDAFKRYWAGALETGALPPGVGSLYLKARKLFLLSDVVPSLTSEAATRAQAQPAAVPRSAQQPRPKEHLSDTETTPLTQRLLDAFDQLDASSGQRNFVPLLELRRALSSVGRAQFDEAVQQLRRDWKLSLDPAEGRHERVPPELIEAGIREGSDVLVYAARREARE